MIKARLFDLINFAYFVLTRLTGKYSPSRFQHPLFFLRQKLFIQKIIQFFFFILCYLLSWLVIKIELVGRRHYKENLKTNQINSIYFITKLPTVILYTPTMTSYEP